MNNNNNNMIYNHKADTVFIAEIRSAPESESSLVSLKL